MLTVFVPGNPKPQGSKTAGRRRDGSIYLREQNSSTRPWRTHVTDRLQLLADGKPLTGAIRVTLDFYMPIPKTVKHPAPTTRSSYDLDKLSRTILDAITNANIIGDDSQVTTLNARKHYSEKPGVLITVEQKGTL